MSLEIREKEQIRVMIVDDHPLIRQGLEMILEDQADMQLVAMAADGEEAVRKAKLIHPDVIILDVQMPGMDGITALEKILENNENSRVLVLTSYGENENVLRAIKSGAMGYLLKESTPEKLLESIRDVNNQTIALHPEITNKLIQEIKKPAAEHNLVDPLTERELEVLACLSRGNTNKEIAQQLTISVRTVTTHVRNILDKLQLSNRTQAALYALNKGIVPKPEIDQ